MSCQGEFPLLVLESSRFNFLLRFCFFLKHLRKGLMRNLTTFLNRTFNGIVEIATTPKDIYQLSANSFMIYSAENHLCRSPQTGKEFLPSFTACSIDLSRTRSSLLLTALFTSSSFVFLVPGNQRKNISVV